MTARVGAGLDSVQRRWGSEHWPASLLTRFADKTEVEAGTVEDLSLSAVLAAMVGVHVLIGVGEAVITFLTIGLVMSSRPDLVHGARGVLRRERAAADAAEAGAAGGRA